MSEATDKMMEEITYLRKRNSDLSRSLGDAKREIERLKDKDKRCSKQEAPPELGLTLFSPDLKIA